MKIIKVEAIPVRLPFKSFVSDSWGTYYASNHGIVVVTAEDFTTGLGEIAYAWHGGAHGLCEEVNRYWSPRLIDLETNEITRLCEVLDGFCVFSKRALLAKAGIEMAVWDLLGKELGVPVYSLLGGKLRASVPLTGGIRMGEPSDMAEEAALRVREGYTELKIKVGLDDRRDIEGVRAIRSAVPDSVRLRADANMAWKNIKHAQKMMEVLYGYGVDIIEQPLGERNLNGLRRLKESAQGMVMLDESVWDARDAAEVIRAEAADMLNVYVGEAGGIEGARQVFRLAAAAGLECVLGSMPEGVIGASASLQVAAAMPNLSDRPSDIRGHTAYAERITAEDLPVSDGALDVPDRPGLGVYLDMEKLNHFRVGQ